MNDVLESHPLPVARLVDTSPAAAALHMAPCSPRGRRHFHDSARCRRRTGPIRWGNRAPGGNTFWVIPDLDFLRKKTYHLDWTSDVEIFLDGLFNEWCNVCIFWLCVMILIWQVLMVLQSNFQMFVFEHQSRFTTAMLHHRIRVQRDNLRLHFH